MRCSPVSSRRAWRDILWLLCIGAVINAATPLRSEEPSAARGYEVLRTKAFLPADFDEEVLSALWTVWPEPERSRAEALSVDKRRLRIFEYYGLTPAPEALDQPLGYIRSADGQYTMNCLSCHGGQVGGNGIAGLGNANYALQTLTEDVRLVKLQQQKPLSHLDLATLRFPLSTTNGTTNAVIFGVILGAFRNPDMSVDTSRTVPTITHHDVDAPPWWHYSRKSSIYCDGFAPKAHRPLMQFMLLPSNDRETIYGWEEDFRHIEAYIASLKPPRYTGPVDTDLAERGRLVFTDHCARCHGTYGNAVTLATQNSDHIQAGDAGSPGALGPYTQQCIPLAEIGTDPVRFNALTTEHRQWMKDGWMSRYGADHVEVSPAGYVAPPLDGIWASAPYLHNGSVPTLWHLLRPAERPELWKRTHAGYDHTRMGLEYVDAKEIPPQERLPARRRAWFDTRLLGKSAIGHDFGNDLTEPERLAVLEYLKTL